MRKLSIIFLLLPVISSCSVLENERITLLIPSSTYVEELFGKDMYYTLSYFDGEGVESRFVGYDEEFVTVDVKRGALSFFALTPIGTFSPLSTYHEPGDDRVLRFGYGDGEFISFLLDVASERPELVSILSLSYIEKELEDMDALSQRLFLIAVEKGRIGKISALLSPEWDAATTLLERGRWYSDKPGVDDIVVLETGNEFTFTLPEGIYRFIHEGKEKMFTLIIAEKGESVGKVSTLPIWY